MQRFHVHFGWHVNVLFFETFFGQQVRTANNCIYIGSLFILGRDHQGKAGMIVKISSSVDTLVFLRNYFDQEYKVFTIHLEIKLLWCSLIIFQIPDHLSQGATYKSCFLHSAAIGFVWQCFLRLCSDLWIVCDGLCSLQFLALDPYKVKELCPRRRRHHHHHHHHHHRHHKHHHHHSYYHSCCTEAMKTRPMHSVNNGMQGFLLSGTCFIAHQLPLEYARQWRTEGRGVQPLPPKFRRRPSKIVLNSTRLWKLLKIAEFRAPTPQDVRKEGSKIPKLPPVRTCFKLAMTNKLVVIINSLKVPKIKKILLYEMKFLVPNYSCLQNPWLGSHCLQIPVLSVLNWICWPPLNKLPGYATDARQYKVLAAGTIYHVVITINIFVNRIKDDEGLNIVVMWVAFVLCTGQVLG